VDDDNDQPIKPKLFYFNGDERTGDFADNGRIFTIVLLMVFSFFFSQRTRQLLCRVMETWFSGTQTTTRTAGIVG
jgi:hypothetical protein